MADVVIRLFSDYSHYKNFFLWKEDDGTLTVHDPNIGKQIGVAFPLPEGYGRLIDADKLIPDMVDYIAGGYGTDGSMHTLRGYSQQQIDNAPTIFEAEVKEDGN